MNKLSDIHIPHTSLRLNVLLVCETVLLLVVSLAVLFYFSRRTLKEEAFLDAEQTLDGTMQHVDNILMSVEQAAYNVYVDLQEHLDEPDRMFTYCHNVVRCNPYIVGCAIAFKPNYYPGRELFMAYVHRRPGDQEGENLSESGSFGSLPYTEQVWYSVPMGTGQACWTDPLPEEEDEGITLSLCLPVLDQQGECVAVMAVDVPVTLLSQIILEAEPLPHSYSVLLGSNGSYIVHPDEAKLTNYSIFQNIEDGADPTVLVASKAMIGGETGYKSFRQDGKDWYVFYKPFLHSWVSEAAGMGVSDLGIATGKLEWSAGMVYLKDDIFGEHNLLIWLVLAITAAGLTLFFISCRMLIRKRMKPLRLLTRCAQRIAEGHYDETVPTAQREDEIGQLQNRFQNMQRSLAAKQAELDQLTAMLQKHSEELSKAYGSAQGSDRMKASFLHYMTTQMTAPADMIEKSVVTLCNNYQELSPEEAEHEVEVIKKESAKVLDLLDHMIKALKIEVEETEKEVREGKEADYE